MTLKKILPLLCVLCLGGCAASAPVSARFESMDTFMQLEVYGSRETVDKLEAEICRLDGLLSTTDAQSDIYRLNRDGTAAVAPTTYELLEKTQEYSRLLDNDLNIFVYPLVEAWGFISRDYRVPAQAEIDALLLDAQRATMSLKADEAAATYEAELIGEHPAITLGAVAKGYAADRAAAILREDGVRSAILNLGGTVAAVGRKPDGNRWRVGICDPENTAAYFGAVECADQFVATSGSYERFFEQDGRRYCHILDPKTGYPADNGTVSVTVISDSGLKSDALSTALFVKGADGAAAFWREHGGFEYILLDSSGALYVTEGVRNDFRLHSGYTFSVTTVGATD